MTLLDPHPFVTFGSFSLATHGALFALGALVAVGTLWQTAKASGLAYLRSSQLVAISFLAGLVAARIGYVISYPDGYSSLWQVASYWQGGLVSYWGILGGAAAGWYLIRKESPEDRRKWIDCMVTACLAGWAVGRFGNYWAYESYGVESGFWSAFYGRVPIQLFESLLCAGLIVFGLLCKRLKPGQIGLVLAAGYFFGRFIIDFWRDDNVYASQWISFLGFLIITAYGYRTAKKR